MGYLFRTNIELIESKNDEIVSKNKNRTYLFRQSKIEYKAKLLLRRWIFKMSHLLYDIVTWAYNKNKQIKRNTV